MPEIVIKYNSPKVLQILKDLANYLGFVIKLPVQNKTKPLSIKGVSIIQANASIDTSDLIEIFSNKNIDAKDLRKYSWQRRK